jgi:acyl transferase domain-containing protein
MANGTIFGEGVRIVVVKRLAEPKEANDYIYAMIKGSAVNNDGMDKVRYTAPGKKEQQEVIRCAISIASVPVESINLIETHDTGTHLGDPIEFEALSSPNPEVTESFCPEEINIPLIFMFPGNTINTLRH